MDNWTAEEIERSINYSFNNRELLREALTHPSTDNHSNINIRSNIHSNNQENPVPNSGENKVDRMGESEVDDDYETTEINKGRNADENAGKNVDENSSATIDGNSNKNTSGNIVENSSGRSARKKRRFNYERLEFLGDAILSATMASYLFQKYPNENEGQLSKRKGFLVSKHTLANVASKLKIGDFMFLSRGEEMSGGRTNTNNLENSMEAIIGAIFLDSNFERARKFIEDSWEKFVFSGENRGIPSNPKSELQELVQGKFKKLPSYKLLESGENGEFIVELSIPNHPSLIKSGRSIREVEIGLAKEMLENIKGND